MINAYINRKKSILAGLLVLVLVFTMSSGLINPSAEAVSRSQLDALKQQQNELAQKKAGIQAQANALSGQVASQTEKLELLAQQLEVTNQELEVISEQIAIYTTTIARMENELAQDKQKERELLEKYKKRLRAMEETGNASYISILLGASDFQDLLSRIDSIKSIMEYDNDLINKVQEAQIAVENAKTEMEAEMASQQEAFTAYQEKQAELEEQKKEAQAVLDSLKADSADYEKQLASVRALQSSIDGQIVNMQNALAEQERIQAEQIASNQISSGNGGSSGSSGNSGWYGDSVGTGTGSDIVSYAKTFLGVPYVYGGTSPSGFDCSGLVYYCYKHYGYTVNRTAAGLAYSGTPVSATSLQIGDIILFTSTDGSYVGHTGLYVGNGQFIHAPHTGDVVKISSLSDAYYTSHYWGARRVIS